ncbi:WD repeat-containing protein 75-like [Gigantopelta aegis]|uniref:WD repeat-containing protein 75-like n=1 Tax=Gigantopelta aegis TaxID=1735272 RepID=UPI001B88B692|nr:WD repeat-containing protein 75-like [Gigantopelta aegis]
MAAAMEHVQSTEDDNPVVCLRAGTNIVDVKPLFSHDSKLLFCCAGYNVKVVSTDSGECIRELKNGHTDRVTGLAINPVCKLQLFTCGLDGQIIFWDYSDGVIVRKYCVNQPLYGLVHVKATLGKKLKVTVSVIQQVSHNTHRGSGYALVQHTLKNLSTKIETRTILNCCQNDARMVSFGSQAEYYTAVQDRHLYVVPKQGNINSFSLMKDIDYHGTPPHFMCVACHPTDLCIATGCSDGKIVLWYNFLEAKRLVKTVHHWHSLAVMDICFTAQGSYFLSGGYECVLVKWQYNSQFKDFLPRQGSPINHVTCSHDNTLYATSHDDNGIHIISSNFSLRHVIQGLTHGHLDRRLDEPIPVGLLRDPQSNALVTNGLPGHLQFFALHTDSQLYNLDIVCQNYISPDTLNKPTVVTEIQCAAFDREGRWLATFEFWDDNVMTPEMQLKFWEFSDKLQKFSLNTMVDIPHTKKIHTLKFRRSDHDLPPMVVTSADDNRFKLWVLVDDTDIYKSRTKWMCESIGFYRDLSSGSVDFSEDGSLLAAAFTTTITLWDPDTNVLKTSLSSAACKDSIRDLLFGRVSCCHLLVSTSATHLTVWNLLSCTVQWSVAMDIPVLTSDPLSSYVAAVSADRDLFVFEPSNPSPVYSHPEVCSSEVLAAIFIPHLQKTSYKGKLSWQRHSQFHFFNRDQQLLTLDSKDSQDESSEIKLKMQQSLPSTPLSLLLSEQHHRHGIKKLEYGTLQSVPQNTKFVKEMLSTPAHVQPSLSSLCQTFVSSLLIHNKSLGSKFEVEDVDDDISSHEDEDSDSDMEVDQSPGRRKTVDTEVKTKQTKNTDMADSSLSGHQQDLENEEKALKLFKQNSDWLSTVLP